MPNFGLETIGEYKPSGEDLVLRFSERLEKIPYDSRDGSKGEITSLVIQAEELENNGFGLYVVKEIHSQANKWTEIQATVPADYAREDLYVQLIRYILKRKEDEKSPS